MFEAFKTKDIIKHKQVEKHYTVEKVPCNLGGYKYFIKCYKCDNKCLKMYISEDKKLVCRTCIGLRKQQLNRNKTDPTRYYKLMMKQCYKVDRNYNPSNKMLAYILTSSISWHLNLYRPLEIQKWDRYTKNKALSKLY